MVDRQKIVLVACGTGIATSTVVGQKVETLLLPIMLMQKLFSVKSRK